ncbi:cytochrome P450 monooxygenase [Aspergillus nomiae NRRL 13137]|uniref:Cytochrome P450 monooxygenase n=1 Tax=Aspergillus nomiae NRRL (strain ATCC 15546 / NRRL 13137 / CBS 260.88 / M93) TaxID=1509407 RepID=A0A0L1JFS3_ASPN3|nr:cytochrome P450 monooxygenase [Aspergillus nomiae NRRL 13137]KNG90233.1 cytochrome P450 monooxygenase [Aspergillus nomiae NRRL 13137]
MDYMDYLKEMGLVWHCVSIFVGLLAFYFIKERSTANASQPSLPTVTHFRLLPPFLNRILYVVKAPFLIYSGYKKYKSKPFRILKLDGDLVILPQRYLEELGDVHSRQASLVGAKYKNILGGCTNILINSELPARTVSGRLNPVLDRQIPRLLFELHHAFSAVVPYCEGKYVSVNLYNMILKLVTHSTSRIIIGQRLCRSEQWINTMTNCTYEVCITVKKLQLVPRLLRRLIAPFLPSVRRLEMQLRWIAEQLIVPIIQHRRGRELNEPSYKKQDDFLQWMMDLADNDSDRDPMNLAYGLMITMALAVVQTSTMLITHAMYDLLVHPEYFEPLRDEIHETLRNGWIRASLSNFGAQRRLDSFLRESQRLNPPSEVSAQRVLERPVTLSDRVTLRKGTHICFPSGPMSRDPAVVSDPLNFDGFRWCNDLDAPDGSLTDVSPANLHFGFGGQACPGRFFGVVIAKAVMSRLLAEYDLKFEEGQTERPKNIVNGEQIMPSMSTKILIKKKNVDI